MNLELLCLISYKVYKYELNSIQWLFEYLKLVTDGSTTLYTDSAIWGWVVAYRIVI